MVDALLYRKDNDTAAANYGCQFCVVFSVGKVADVL